MNVLRRRILAWALPGCALLLGACPPPKPQEQQDPCIEVGTSADGAGFKALSEVPGVSVVYGPQGSSHIWLAIRARGLAPEETAVYGTRFGIKDVLTGQALTPDWLQSTVELSPPDGTAVFAAYLQGGATSNLVGRQVLLWADVTDDPSGQCAGGTHDERATTVVQP